MNLASRVRDPTGTRGPPRTSVRTIVRPRTCGRPAGRRDRARARTPPTCSLRASDRPASESRPQAAGAHGVNRRRCRRAGSRLPSAFPRRSPRARVRVGRRQCKSSRVQRCRGAQTCAHSCGNARRRWCDAVMAKISASRRSRVSMVETPDPRQPDLAAAAARKGMTIASRTTPATAA